MSNSTDVIVQLGSLFFFFFFGTDVMCSIVWFFDVLEPCYRQWCYMPFFLYIYILHWCYCAYVEPLVLALMLLCLWCCTDDIVQCDDIWFLEY